MAELFPPEIVTNILSRLPVKPLLRFRCVSKPWCSLIDSPYFAKMHLNQSLKAKSNRNLTLRFIDNSAHSIEFHSFDSINSRQCIKLPISDSYVLSSCNGLAHMSKKISGYTHNYIWNPFTGKLWELPAISYDLKVLSPEARIGVRLVEKHGFAYVAETDEYKLVQITEFRGSDFRYIGNQACIFSSGSNEWERLEQFPYQILPRRELEAHLNGVLHAITAVIETDFSQWELMAFDTKTKKHSKLPKPDFASMFGGVTVEVLDENVCLLHTCGIMMDIWVMKDYGVKSSWFKKLSVGVEQSLDTRGITHVRRTLIMTSTDDGADVLLIDNGKKLIWYGLSDGSVRKVMANGLPWGFCAEVWYESLVSFTAFISVDDGKAKSHSKGEKEDDVNKKSQQKRLEEKG